MAFNKEFITYIIEAITGKNSSYQKSFKPNKKFSDVVKMVRDFKLFETSMKGKVMKDVDTGKAFVFSYDCAGGQGGAAWFDIKIVHHGEKIEYMEFDYFCGGAHHCVNKAIEKIEKTLEDYTSEDSVEATIAKEPIVEKEDYSGKTLAELVDIMDKELQSFAKSADKASFETVVAVKEAIEASINEKPLAERGAFSSAISNLNMYVSAIKTQFTIPGANVSTFLGTYIPQMQQSIIEISSKL